MLEVDTFRFNRHVLFVQGHFLQFKQLHYGNKISIENMEEGFLEDLEYLPHPTLLHMPGTFSGRHFVLFCGLKFHFSAQYF